MMHPKLDQGTAVLPDDPTIDLVDLAIRANAIRCRIPGTERLVTLRAQGRLQTVPGEVITVRRRRSWSYAGHPYLSGEIEHSRLDLALLDLAPLGIHSRGQWDSRPAFELEQALPGWSPAAPDADPIGEAVGLAARGATGEAERLLMDRLARDLRCLDAHAHLGNLCFRFWPGQALRHYEAGVRIGGLSLAPSFRGLLPWGLIDNRPFLECLHGQGLSLWRLDRMDEAAAVFERMLSLNPDDNQGARFCLEDVQAGRAWSDAAEVVAR